MTSMLYIMLIHFPIDVGCTFQLLKSISSFSTSFEFNDNEESLSQ